jgi:predicted nucleotide-binding protein
VTEGPASLAVKEEGVAPRRRTENAVSEAEPLLRVARSKLHAEIVERLELGQHLLDRCVPSADGVNQIGVNQTRDDYYTWDEFNEQLLRSRFTSGKVADTYRGVIMASFGPGSPQQELHRLHEDINRKRRQLESIREQLPLYESEVEETAGDDWTKALARALGGTKVFIVHGHDGSVKLEVADFLQRITGERPIILHEKADSGRTVIEKFEDYASEAGFAVVLLTADDVGSAKGAASLNPRARQNVVLELGFFYAALGRGRVVALYEDGVEIPSDIMGVLYKPLSGNWHTELAKELRAAEIDIDPAKLF